MILVKITNSTEVVASKTHKLFGKTPFETIDKSIVEAQVIKQMSDDLAAWGLEGSISIVKGLDVQDYTVVTRKGFLVKQTKSFGKNVNNDPAEYSKPR